MWLSLASSPLVFLLRSLLNLGLLLEVFVISAVYVWWRQELVCTFLNGYVLVIRSAKTRDAVDSQVYAFKKWSQGLCLLYTTRTLPDMFYDFWKSTFRVSMLYLWFLIFSSSLADMKAMAFPCSICLGSRRFDLMVSLCLLSLLAEKMKCAWKAARAGLFLSFQKSHTTSSFVNLQPVPCLLEIIENEPLKLNPFW